MINYGQWYYALSASSPQLEIINIYLHHHTDPRLYQGLIPALVVLQPRQLRALSLNMVDSKADFMLLLGPWARVAAPGLETLTLRRLNPADDFDDLAAMAHLPSLPAYVQHWPHLDSALLLGFPEPLCILGDGQSPPKMPDSVFFLERLPPGSRFISAATASDSPEWLL